MNMLNNNEINIFDLPDEMLLFIFNKLNNIDILYSLVDVNHRFDRLALNSLGIHDLDFTDSTLFHHKFKEYNELLDRICKNILPRIHHQINKLTFGQLSMEHVLHTCNFPQLHSLSLVLVQSEQFFLYIGMFFNIPSFNQIIFYIFKIIRYLIIFFVIKSGILISVPNRATDISLN